MISKDGGVWWVTCDTCSDGTDLIDEGEEFQMAVDAAKEAGWRIYTDENATVCHMCPSCLEGMG